MKIVIIGTGTVGETLMQLLCAEQHDITIIDCDPLLVEDLSARFDVMGIIGNGVSYDVQAEAGVKRADLVIAVTQSDEQNLLCCVTAKRLGAKHTVARVRNPEYLDQVDFFSRSLGIDLIVNPEMETAHEIENSIHYPAAIKLEHFTNGRVSLVKIKVTAENPLIGHPLREFHSIMKTQILVCAVQRDAEVFIPNGDFVLEEDDAIYVTAPHGNINALFRSLNMDNTKIKDVMIVGGGETTVYLAKMLQKRNIFVKIIEIDPKVCETLSDLLPKASVICGDGTNSDLLVEEGIEHTDAIVTLTDCDEENIIISMYAKTKGVEKIITQITKSPLEAMLPDFGFDTVSIAPQAVIANTILRYVRGIEHVSGETSIRTLYRLLQNRVEALEFEVSEPNENLGIPLKDLSLIPNLLIGYIVRDKNVIYPQGDTTIEVGDRVIIVTTTNGLRSIEDIFA